MRNILDPINQLLESREIELYSTPPTRYAGETRHYYEVEYPALLVECRAKYTELTGKRAPY